MGDEPRIKREERKERKERKGWIVQWLEWRSPKSRMRVQVPIHLMEGLDSDRSESL